MTSEHHGRAPGNGTGSLPESGQAKARANAKQPAGSSKIVKRYSNRKLYDTERSKYVTLDEIARMIKAGDEVTIIDNESKEDLTSVTLTQIIYEEEKRESRMPLAMLRNLIQTGGTSLQDFFDRSVKAPVVGGFDSAQKSVEKSVEELRQSALQIKDNAARSVNEITDAARRLFSREERKAEEFQKAVKILFDHLDERLSNRVAEVAAAQKEMADRKAQTEAQGAATEDGTADRPVEVAEPGEPAKVEGVLPGPEAGAEPAVTPHDEPLRVDAHVQMIRERLAAVQVKVDALSELSS